MSQYKALNDLVAIELLLEGQREKIYQKISLGENEQALQANVSRGSPPLSSSSVSEFIIVSTDLHPSKEDANSYFKDKFSPSREKLNRTFNVTYKTQEYFYYAFVLNGYIVCPAFLANFLGLNEYSCLEVKHHLKYYYIFLD